MTDCKQTDTEIAIEAMTKRLNGLQGKINKCVSQSDKQRVILSKLHPSKPESITVQAEIEGEMCFILIPDNCDELILNFIASLSKNGKLQVAKSPSYFGFKQLIRK